jgi:phage terminase large subunit
MENFLKEPTKNMFVIRKNANTFKHKQYQLLTIVGSIDSEQEYENSKLLQQMRLG